MSPRARIARSDAPKRRAARSVPRSILVVAFKASYCWISPAKTWPKALYYICLGKARLGLKRKGNEETSVVKKAVDLDLDAFTRRTAMAGAGSEKSARLLFCLSFDAPFFDPRDQHSGVKQAGFCLGGGRRCGSGDP